MPDSAQLLNYHTGLFLEVGEFTLEQNYHRRLRRAVNYALFSPGIIYGLQVEYDGTSPTARVRPGIAVNNDPATMMANEIILAADYDVPLTGIGSGQVYIVLSYETRDGAVKPSSPPGNPATTIEVARIEAVRAASFIPDPGTKIVLGTITIATALPSPIPGRQMAQIRAELLPAGGPPPGIVVTPPSVAAGTTAVLTVVATGSFDLTGVGPGDVSIIGSGISGLAISGNTGTQMQVSFTVAAGASGTPTLQITKGAVVVSADFTITAGLTLNGYVGVDVPGGVTDIRLNGTGFSAPATVEFSAGGGAFTAPVSVPAANVTSTQIRVEMASIPAAAVKGPVRVTVPSNPPITSSFDFVPPALGVTLVQTSRTPGELLDITGSRFIEPVTVLFATYTATVTRGPSSTPPFPSAGLGELPVTSTALKVSVPAGAQTGRVRIVTGPAAGRPQSESQTVESSVSLTVS